MKPPEELSHEMEKVSENNEISIHYMSTGEVWDINQIVVDNIFLFKVALDITTSNSENITRYNGENISRSNDDNKPQTVEE